MRIKNQTRNSTLVYRGKLADTFLARLKGLLGSAPLETGQGLLLKNEKSIHTFFMTFPIDVVYINHALEIIKLDVNMPPFKLGKFVSRSTYILELPVGTIQATHTAVGDRLVFLED